MKSKINIQTIVRTIVLALALVNQVLTALGKNPLPFSEEEAYQIFTLIFSFGASIWAWWKNNSFSKPAREADKYMQDIKKQRLTYYEEE